jgi:hypothetical protein
MSIACVIRNHFARSIRCGFDSTGSRKTSLVPSGRMDPLPLWPNFMTHEGTVKSTPKIRRSGKFARRVQGAKNTTSDETASSKGFNAGHAVWRVGHKCLLLAPHTDLIFDKRGDQSKKPLRTVAGGQRLLRSRGIKLAAWSTSPKPWPVFV